MLIVSAMQDARGLLVYNIASDGATQRQVRKLERERERAERRVPKHHDCFTERHNTPQVGSDVM